MYRFSLNTNCLHKTKSSSEIALLAQRLKFDGIEWGLPSIDKVPSAVKEMAQVTSDQGLQIVSFINGPHLWKTDSVRRYSEAIASAGGKMLRVAHPWVAWNYDESLHQPDSFMDLFKQAREGLENLQPISYEYGVRYVVELHAGSLCASPTAVRHLLDGLNPACVGAIYDPANTLVEGYIRPRNAVESLGPYLAYLHVKNIVINYHGQFLSGPFPRPAFAYHLCDLDAGALDYLEVLFALNLTKFDGWLSFEEFFADNTETKLSKAMTYIQQCARIAPDQIQLPYTNFNA